MIITNMAEGVLTPSGRTARPRRSDHRNRRVLAVLAYLGAG
jgi:hypothetical protein